MIRSKLREYIGIATQTLMDDETMELEVVITEILPMIEGTVTEDDEPEQRSIKVKNSAKNGPTSAEVKVTDRIVCEYFGCMTNVSRPNIHISEQVKVINIAGTEKFYWFPLGRDDKLRTTERLKIRISDKPKQQDPLDDDHSTFIDMDSREEKRKVHIHTSKGTEEKVSYDILIDLEKSEISMVDSEDNGWHFKSLDSWFRIWNNKGSEVIADKEDVTWNAPNSYTINTKHYKLNASEDIETNTKVTTHNSSESITNNTKATTHNSEDTVDTNTTNNTLKCTEDVTECTNRTVTAEAEIKWNATTKATLTTTLFAVVSPVTTFSGGVTVGAFLGVSGGTVPGAPSGPSQFAGDIQHEGNYELKGEYALKNAAGDTDIVKMTESNGMEVTGDISASGTVVGTNITASHTHVYGAI